MAVLTVFLAMPVAAVSLVSAYLLVLCLASWTYKPRYASDGQDLHFAVVIPAHNEGDAVAGVLRDAFGQDYPADRREVFVIADNCADDTASVAREAGARVVERFEPERRGKGPALDWFLREHRDALQDFDAVAIVDADMRIAPHFLAHLDASLRVPGIDVVQSLNTVSNAAASWRAALGFASFSLINHVRPAGRCRLGGTAELKGSGMAFRTELLLRYGWPSESRTEDVEFSKQLLLDGIRVHYNPCARVTSPIVGRRSQVEVQQRRWESGKAGLIRQWLPRMFRAALRERKWCYWDAVLDFLVPPLSLLVTAQLLCLAASVLVNPVLAVLSMAALVAVCFCVVSGLLQQRAPLKTWLYLATVPFFIAWKVPLLLRLAVGREHEGWRRTPRDHEVEDQERERDP